MSSPTPLRRELLASLGILFGGVTILLGIALSLMLPFFRSPSEATAFILVIVAVDLVIVLTFGGWALKTISANVRETRSTQRIRVGRRQRKRTCWDCEREWKRMVVPLEPGRPSEARQLLRTQR